MEAGGEGWGGGWGGEGGGGEGGGGDSGGGDSGGGDSPRQVIALMSSMYSCPIEFCESEQKKEYGVLMIRGT